MLNDVNGIIFNKVERTPNENSENIRVETQFSLGFFLLLLNMHCKSTDMQILQVSKMYVL